MTHEMETNNQCFAVPPSGGASTGSDLPPPEGGPTKPPPESGTTKPLAEGGTAQPAIRLRGVRKSFGDQKVLDCVDLDVPRGETVTVLGRSGTGKSVMLKLIIGLQRPDAGEIEINGTTITGLPLEELNRIRKKVGFLFQGAALYDSLTVEENVAFPLHRHAKMSDDELETRVRASCSRA